jgi:hypothetical protein
MYWRRKNHFYSSLKKTIIARKKGYKPGISGRRSRLNTAEESHLEKQIKELSGDKRK